MIDIQEQSERVITRGLRPIHRPGPIGVAITDILILRPVQSSPTAASANQSRAPPRASVTMNVTRLSSAALVVLAVRVVGPGSG